MKRLFIGLAVVFLALVCSCASYTPPSSRTAAPAGTRTSTPSVAVPELTSREERRSDWSAKADLHVENHCSCEGPRGQTQVKVKLRITNTSPDPLDISIGNIRLLVPNDNLGSWTPNGPTAEMSLIQKDGVTYAAYPPNANHAWEPEYATWASFWSGTTLAPGDEYFDGGKMAGDVVFYVPLSLDQISRVAGIALVSADGHTLLGWQAMSDWRGLAVPSGF